MEKKGQHYFLGINANGMREIRTACRCGLETVWEAHPEASEDFLMHFLPECEKCARELRPLN